ncbi:hypothetical protein Rs2_36305 [Raphanus sativus]|nr:hypothetical protein Rs2_36305 [Raphanus sativus]
MTEGDVDLKESHDIPPESYHPPPQGYPWAPPPHQEGNPPPPPPTCDHEAQYQFYFVGNYRYPGRTPPTQPLKIYKLYQQDHYQDSNSGGSSFLHGCLAALCCCCVLDCF